MRSDSTSEKVQYGRETRKRQEERGSERENPQQSRRIDRRPKLRKQ